MISAMYGVGKLFPRGDRSPAIVPLAEADLTRRIALEPLLADWRVGRTNRITRGFYISQGLELAHR
jgi:magnesium-protoporphyrin O-methyltransferase